MTYVKPSIPMNRRMLCLAPSVVKRIEAVLGEGNAVDWRRWCRWTLDQVLERAEKEGRPFPLVLKQKEDKQNG